MRKPIVMPDVAAAEAGTADAGAAPVLHLWFVAPGDQVYAGDRLVEVLLDSATFDVSSSATGRLLEKTARPGDSLITGQILGFIEEDVGDYRE